MLNIEIDDREVLAALDRLRRRVDDLSPAMRNIAQLLESETEGNFQNERGQGGAWPALKPATVLDRLRKRYEGPMLQRTGALARSVGSAYGRDFAVVGVAQRTPGGRFSLGAIHQFGAPKRNIPPRPFLPVDAAGVLDAGVTDDILDIIGQFLDTA